MLMSLKDWTISERNVSEIDGTRTFVQTGIRTFQCRHKGTTNQPWERFLCVFCLQIGGNKSLPFQRH